MRAALNTSLAFILAACAMAAAYADPPGRVARLSYTAGAVSFAPAEAPNDWIQAIVNRPLTSGDRLWADRGGRAELQVGPTAVRLAPYTALDILHLDDDRLQLRVLEGSVNVRVRDLDSNDVVEIATPEGAALVRQPGSYRVSVDPSADAARVTVNFGQADVIASGYSYTVPSGQSAALREGVQPAFEIASHAQGDEFDRWSAERDRQNDRIVSTRYVSPHMTGYQDLDRYGTWRTEPEYGAVWTPSNVAPDWAPYRHGHWAWISPWGWTWIDDAPWGFAPSHYGRWVWLHDHWAWAPGSLVRRPVYAPALVAFVGGSDWSLSVTSGPAVGWFPLGWREPYRPWYRASPTYVRNVNHTHVTHVTNVNVRHVHRARPDAVTVVPQQAFVSGRPAWRSRVNVRRDDIDRAPIVRERPAEPTRVSIAPDDRRGARPPERRRNDDERRAARERFEQRRDDDRRFDRERNEQDEAARELARQRAARRAEVAPAPFQQPQPRIRESQQRVEAAPAQPRLESPRVERQQSRQIDAPRAEERRERMEQRRERQEQRREHRAERSEPRPERSEPRREAPRAQSAPVQQPRVQAAQRAEPARERPGYTPQRAQPPHQTRPDRHDPFNEGRGARRRSNSDG
ncbi:MAG TPA: DUF6600 domain-containing protein [Burkholderiales bacterium]|nr:DUF6600 domain-containing protein [Burkholderiales bacterium]